MTDTRPPWRTVATHGQPTDADCPALIRSADRDHFIRRSTEAPLIQPDTRWIPLVELDTLPDAPPPPRTVTITITDDDARVLENDWSEYKAWSRIIAAVKAALEADKTTP